MSVFDRRSPQVTPKPKQYACEHCPFTSTDPEETFNHLFTRHVNRRVASVSPNAGRRADDPRPTESAWVRRARAGTLSPGGAMPTGRTGRLS